MANAATNTGETRGGRKNDDYDPHLHRQVPKATNNLETLMHLLKCSIGTGILALPQGFSRAGLGTGTIAIFVCGVWMTHCLRILILSKYEACKIKRVPNINYPDAIHTAADHGPPAFRPYGRALAIAVDVFLVTSKLGTCCIYILFIASNLKKMIDPYYLISLEVWMFTILIPLIIFNLIPSLKLLAPFSTFANFITLVAVIMTIYYMVSYKKHESTYTEAIDWWGTAKMFPLFFGTIIFALTSVPVVVSLEMNMKYPKSFTPLFGVLNIGMVIIVVLYTIFGIIGYLYCKSDCSDSITLDLPPGFLAISVQALMVVAIFISYGLHCYVPVEVLWTGYILPRLERKGVTNKMRYNYALRIFLCTLTFILAISIPRLGLFISLSGSLCLGSLSLCFPPLMDYCVRWPDRFGPGEIYKYFNIFLSIVGIIGLSVGTYVAVLNIVLSLF